MKADREPIIIRLQNATLDDKGGDIVAHGWLGPDAFGSLHVGPYQREVLGRTAGQRGPHSYLEKALSDGARFPDVVLGMRGQRYNTRGAHMFLEDDVYIIDGLQRISALKKAAEAAAEDKSADISMFRIGAEVRFGTTQDSETELFSALNTNRMPMSPNVLLRNARTKHEGILTLYGLSTNEPKFALYGRLQWNQRMSRNELISAAQVAKAMMVLHRRLGGTTGSSTTNIKALPERMDKMVDRIGLRNFRENVMAFYGAMDEIWGVRNIHYNDLASHLRGCFTMTLAAVMADHENFWDGKRLVVDAKAKSKLGSFPIMDPQIATMARSMSGVNQFLYNLIRDHMNKSKRINRLIEREEAA